MFSMSFRNRQKATDSPRVATGSPRIDNGSPRGASDSPRVEVGEIDTRAPFQSVKAAVSLFGEVVSKGKPVIRRSKPTTSSENVIDKETQLLFAQNELNKLKEHLKNLETTKARGVSDLERARRTLQELTNKLKSVSESKESAIQVTEDVKNQVMQLEASISGSPMGHDGSWKQDLDEAKEQYVATFAELDAAKQQLTKVRQDFDAALEAKMVSFEQAADAQYAAKVNTDRISELSKEIAAIRESRSQVKLAFEQSQQEHTKILADKNARLQSHKTAMEEAESKLLALKKEFDPELSIVLEENLAETTAEIEALQSMQEEMKRAHASDMESVRIITSELNDATKTLQQVAEEENVLRNLVDSLKLEVENLRSEHMKLTENEEETESVADDLRVKLQESKAELEATIMEDTKAREDYDDLISKLQEISLETENTERETEEVEKNAEQLKREAETARIAVEESEKNVPVAEREAKDAEVAEKNAIDEIRILSERANANAHPDSQSGASSKIKLSVEEFESLSRKAEESENLAEIKLSAAKAQLEAINASQNEANKMLMANLEEIEDIRAATDAALKQAEMAEAAKQAVEGELRRWRSKEKNKGVEVASQDQGSAEMSP